MWAKSVTASTRQVVVISFLLSVVVFNVRRVLVGMSLTLKSSELLNMTATLLLDAIDRFEYSLLKIFGVLDSMRLKNLIQV